jgi:hypothetical protein
MKTSLADGGETDTGVPKLLKVISTVTRRTATPSRPHATKAKTLWPASRHCLASAAMAKNTSLGQHPPSKARMTSAS